MRILRILLRRLFLKSGPRTAPPQQKEVGQPLTAFEAWIRGYRQRLDHNCEKNKSPPRKGGEPPRRDRLFAFQTDSVFPDRDPIQRVRHLAEQNGFAMQS